MPRPDTAPPPPIDAIKLSGFEFKNPDDELVGILAEALAMDGTVLVSEKFRAGQSVLLDISSIKQRHVSFQITPIYTEDEFRKEKSNEKPSPDPA